MLLPFSGFAADRPNILIFFIDDMGYGDPSCFGNELVETPHIDSLAAEGRRFTNFYVNSPICSASRVALSTGQYQQRWRIQSHLASRKANAERKMADYLDPAAIHTAQIFHDAGYRTAHFGKWHMGGGRDVDDAPHPAAYGFEEALVSFEGLGDRLLFGTGNLDKQSAALGQGKITQVEKRTATQRYVDRAREFISREDDRPFYLELFPNDVHDRFIPTDEAAAKFSAVTDNPEEQKFFAVLTEMDRQIGRLLAQLETNGQVENTIVIFTSDNGATDWPRYYKAGIEPPGSSGPFFGRKWSLYEGGIRMPFIIRWPGHVPAQTTDNISVVAAFDIQPTLLALTGTPTPKGKLYDGRDRSAVLLGEPALRDSPVFWEYGAYGSLAPGKAEHASPYLAMRLGNWKFLINPDGTDPQLYDLSTDIREQHNLVATHPALVNFLTERTLKWWSEMSAHYAPDL
ncbi:MAG: sulfatase-like hydrolase/transferase [Opitutaceae bacterium]|nr:sulfatase-like hydrolase/transferase [Opitutaceae bacterium]